MKSLNLDHLHALRLVIEHGSFTTAADRLGITQPAVSLQIRQLEHQLGAALVERVGRKALPTPAGADLLAHAGQIEAAVSTALEAVGRHVTGGAGRVAIGTGATACIFILPPILRRLRKSHPELEIIVTTGNTSDIVAAVEVNTIDIGLVTLPASGRALEITPVLQDAFVLIAPPDMRLPAQMTAEAISRMPALLFEPGGNTRRLVDDWFAAQEVRLKPVMSLGSVEAIKELVKVGLGCAILPGMAVPRSEGLGKRLLVRPLSPSLHRTLAVIIRRDKRLSRGLRDTLNELMRLALST